MLEAFLSVLGGKPTDEVVWTADLSYWIHAERERGRAPDGLESELGFLEFCRELGVMPYYSYRDFWLAEPQYGPDVQLTTVKDGHRTIARFQTPVGELVRESAHLPTSFSTGVTKHFVASEQDLDTLIVLIEGRRLVPAGLDGYSQRLALWRRYDGLPSVALPRSPIAALFCEWAGVQNTVYLLADCPSKVEHLLELMACQEDAVIDAVCESAPPVVHFADNLSSETMTSLYDRYLGPHHRRRIERLHQHDIRCAVHLDGTVLGLLPRLADVGFDAVEAVTPSPVGDLTAQEMREASSSDRLALWGGVPGAMFAPPYAWDDMRTHVQSTLDDWRGTPFVLGVADQVPPDGDISFCRRIADLISA